MPNYSVSEEPASEELALFFAADPTLYAYHLGDLDPTFSNSVKWFVCRDSVSRDILAVTLLYTPPEVPALQALGESGAQECLWGRLADRLPVKLHAHYRLAHTPAIQELYDISPIGVIFKMRWSGDESKLKGRADDNLSVVVMTSEDERSIRELQARAYPDSFFDSHMLRQGKCAGVYDGEKLVSFGACHVCSPERGVAALGAIMTDSDYRGRGLAQAVTRALIRNIADDIGAIMLNVHSQNSVAIHLYQSLGFAKHCEYAEGILTRR